MKNVEAQLSGVDPAGLQLDSCTSALWLPIVPCECSFSSIAWGCCKGSALGGKARSTRELNSLEGDWRHSCLRLGSFFTFQSPSGGLRQHLPWPRLPGVCICWLCVLSPHCCCCFSGSISLLNHLLMSPPLRNWPSPPPPLKHPTGLFLHPESSAMCLTQQINQCVRLAVDQPYSG